MKASVLHLTYEIVLEPGEELKLPQELLASIGPGRWRLIIQPVHEPTRDHSAFLNSYAPEDEGLYDDTAAG